MTTREKIVSVSGYAAFVGLIAMAVIVYYNRSIHPNQHAEVTAEVTTNSLPVTVEAPEIRGLTNATFRSVGAFMHVTNVKGKEFYFLPNAVRMIGREPNDECAVEVEGFGLIHARCTAEDLEAFVTSLRK